MDIASFSYITEFRLFDFRVISILIDFCIARLLKNKSLNFDNFLLAI